MVRVIFVFLYITAIFQQVSAQNSGSFEKHVFSEGGETLPYRLLEPAAQSSESFPLVIFLHGVGERGNDNEVQTNHMQELFLDQKNRTKFPCFVIAPQCPKGHTWSNFKKVGGEATLNEHPTMPMKLLMSLIEKILKEHPIDRTRIYVIGLSMGGFGTFDLIARHPEKFAAAVPICGGGDTKTANKIKDIPIWAFHGALDKVVTPSQSRRMINALQDVKANPTYTEYPSVGHDSWTNAFREPNLLPWLFKQKRAENIHHN